MFKKYYRLTKPGIVYGNSLAAAAGFLLAARGHVPPLLFAATLAGLALIMASACVTNNYIDQDIDALMERTKRRGLVSGQISGPAALIFATALGVIGTILLAAFTNQLALNAALAGWVLYVLVYGYWKRRSVYGTQVGSLSGAVPPLVGYVAATGRLDLGAWLLFAILVLWQMPHFYAIAIFRQSDYAAAAIPVLPVKRGVKIARNAIIGYIAAFIIATQLLTVFSYAGLTTAIVTAAAGLWWLRLSLGSWKIGGEVVWARQVFRRSLLVLLVMCLMWSLNIFLP